MISRTSSPVTLSLLALLCVAACANLTPIPAGVCGNAVTEPGEDCDGESNCHAAGTTFACRYRCETDEECLEGACGVDGVCRRPSGSFQVKQAVPSSATLSLVSGDLDADGKDDVIREGAELTDVLFIGEDGLIEAAETIQRLREINPPLIADLTEAMGADEVNRLDVAFSVNLGDETGSGLSVYRTQQDRTLEATAYPTLPIPGDKIRGITARVVGNDERQEILGFVSVSAMSPVPKFAGFGAEQELVALALDREPNVAAFVGVAVGELFDNGCDEVVYGELAHAGATGRDVWVVVPCEPKDEGKIGWRTGGVGNAEVTTLTLPPGVELAYPDEALFDAPGEATTGLVRDGIFVADLQGDGRDDVFAVAVGSDRVPRLYVAVRTDDDMMPFMPFTELPCEPCRDLGYPLAVADLGVGPAADYVFEEGIVLAADPMAGGPFVAFDALDGASWLAAEIADFDRDGFADVAVSRTDDEADGPAQGIEILRNTGSGLFTRDLVPTQRPVAHITTGDFDGDGAADLAYVEHDFSVDLPATQGPGSGFPLHVAFGQTSGGPTPTRKVGELPFVEQIIAGPVLGGDGAAELLALAQPQNKTALAIFGGNASRQLVAPFFFSFRSGGDLVAGRIDAAVAGTFEPGGGTQLAVLTHSITADESLDGYAEDVLWRVGVGAEAELMPKPPIGISMEDEIPDAKCFECLLVAYDPDGDGVDELYAFEDLTLSLDAPSAGMRIRRFAPSDMGFEEAAVVAEIPNLIAPVLEELLTVNPPVIRDIDGDGDDDLALIGAFVEQEEDTDEDDIGFGIVEQVVLIFYNDEGSLGDYEIVRAPTQPEAGVAFVTSFTFLQVDPDPDLELVLSEIVDDDDQETGAVWILDVGPDTGGYGGPERTRPLLAGPELPLLVRALTSGDYDGDGVDDVIVGGDELYVMVRGEPAEP